MNKSSSIEYLTRLNISNTFLSGSYDLQISEIIDKIKEGNLEHTVFQIHLQQL